MLETIVSQIIFGLQRGTIYALIALGYTMVYGVVRIINFAYGELFMLGAFFAFFTVSLSPLPTGYNLILAFLIPMFLSGVLGYAIDYYAYRPLRSKPRLAALITAIGISFFLGNLVSYLSADSVRLVARTIFMLAGVIAIVTVCQIYVPFFRQRRTKPIFWFARVALIGALTGIGSIFWIAKPYLLELHWKGSSFSAFPVERIMTPVKYPLFGSVYITNIQIMNLLISLILMALLWFLVNKTMIGMAMRACQNNKEAVYLMGINVNFIISLTFIIGTSLAGAAGVLSAITYPRITALMGIQPGLKAFIAAVVGGIGSIQGAMLGGIILGLAEQLAIGLLPSDFGPNHTDFTPLAEGVAFGLLIIVLLVRPQGIFGEPPKEKI